MATDVPRFELPGSFGRFDRFLVPGKEVQPVRRALYRSDAPGFAVFPGFVPSPYLEHIQRFWLEAPPPAADFAPWEKRKAYPAGFPSMRSHSANRTSYMQFFWNAPFDEVTASAAMAVGQLRNLVEGKVPYRGLLLDGSRAATTRVVISRHSDEYDVRPHEDPFPGEGDELVRLQATLFLSSYGTDYTGEGFCLRTRQGEVVRFGSDVPIQPGDLVLWRYLNEHWVGALETPPGGSGFVRVIFPLENVERPSVKTQPIAEKKKTSKAPTRGPVAHQLHRARKLAWRVRARLRGDR